MSVLLVLLPARPRLAAGGEAGTPAPGQRAPGIWRYVWSGNGQQADRSGAVATDLLPKAETLIAVVPAADLSWQRITLPRAPAARLRAALAGALEDSLLEDAEALHFALPPQPQPGSATWVAVAHRGWLATLVGALEDSGRSVDRLVPEAAPPIGAGEVAQGHFHARGVDPSEVIDGMRGESLLSEAADPEPLLTLAGGNGCCQLRLSGALAGPLTRGQLGDAAAATRWTATPAAAAAAEQWLVQQGLAQRIELQSDAQHLLQCRHSLWNLRQFDLLPQLRGTRAAREALRRLASPAWRPFRIGLAALLLLNLVGLNAWAWQQSRTVQARREAVVELLKTTHPQVRAVLDAPLQMQRETDLLRAAAGRVGETDFEALLAAATTAWPDGAPPLASLRFENAQLAISAPGAGEAQAAALRERLRILGLDARFADNRLLVQRAAAPR
jgi:general secretion pathway protein L